MQQPFSAAKPPSAPRSRQGFSRSENERRRHANVAALVGAALFLSPTFATAVEPLTRVPAIIAPVFVIAPTVTAPAVTAPAVIAPVSPAQQAVAKRAPTLLSPTVSAALSSPVKPILGLPSFLAIGPGNVGLTSPLPADVVGSGRHDDPKLDCGAACSDRSSTQGVDPGVRALAGAAAGISAGVALFLTESRKNAPSLAPSFRFNVSGTKATAKIVWRF